MDRYKLWVLLCSNCLSVCYKLMVDVNYDVYYVNYDILIVSVCVLQKLRFLTNMLVSSSL